MTNITFHDSPTTLPTVSPEVVTSVEPFVADDSHVYVHCHFNNRDEGLLVRIWKTTYLIDHASGSRSTLLHTENISLAPQWTKVPNTADYSFLLIFSALPKSCLRFDFKEEIPQPGGFMVSNIPRNDKDLYHVQLF